VVFLAYFEGILLIYLEGVFLVYFVYIHRRDNNQMLAFFCV